MIKHWLKSKLPRSLFGRAMLILAVPVVVVQIVVAIFFAERLFRDVSEQMSSSVALSINYAIQEANKAPDIETAQARLTQITAPLDILAQFHTPPPSSQNRWYWYDLSGRYVADALMKYINNSLYVDLHSNRKRAQVSVLSNKGPVLFIFARARASATNPHQLLVAMVLTGLFFTTIAVFFLNNQIRPIRQLSEAAEAFGRGWSTPFTPRGAREVRSASHAFLAMRSRIIRQIEQRTMLLTGVSHDLRTPLTRMKLSLDLLEPSDEIAHLKRDVDEMENMLVEFLEFAHGDSEENTENISIKALTKRIVRNFKRAEYDVDLKFIGDTQENAQMKCRATAVQRAIENLIGNAKRYANTARLTVDIRPEYVEFIVEDDGPGIPKDDRALALEPFSRLDAARNQDKGGGSGLGLAITTDTARSHGGKFTLMSSQDLGGLKAVLNLPR